MATFELNLSAKEADLIMRALSSYENKLYYYGTEHCLQTAHMCNVLIGAIAEKKEELNNGEYRS